MKSLKYIQLTGLALAFVCGGSLSVIAQGNGKGNQKEVLKGGGNEQNDGGKSDLKNAKDPIKPDQKGGKEDIKHLQGKPEEKGGPHKNEHGKPDNHLDYDKGGPHGGKPEGHGNGHDKGKGEGHPGHEGKAEGHDKGHGNGNAYGHHKGGLEGREFGQARAEEARNKHKEIIIYAEKTVSAEEVHIQTAKDRLKAAYASVDAMKANPKADKAAISAREDLLRQADAKLKDLERQVEAGKAVIKRAQSLGSSVTTF